MAEDKNKYIDAHGKHGIDAGHAPKKKIDGGPETSSQMPGSENYGPAFGTSDPNEYPKDAE